jgi:hypothetical protein
MFEGSFAPVIGREVLRPDADSEVLARFADGEAALTRHSYGSGLVYVVGFFPGLEYSATVRRPDYSMRRDLDPVRRRFVAAPALELTRPVVDASDPLVEGVLLQSADGTTRAVTLANWAYGVAAIQEDASGRRSPVIRHMPARGLEITIRTTEKPKNVVSCMLQAGLEFTESDGAVVVDLPQLEEGDLLLLH